MNKTHHFILLTLAIIGLSGCATSDFSVVGDNQYRISKNSDACAAGSPEAVLGAVKQEATRFCASRKERPVEIRSDAEYGIPVLRCASAWMVFSCEK